MKKIFSLLFSLLLFFAFSFNSNAQQSVARQWNEALLNAIRHNYAKPTVHARNLFHVSMAMYDAWAAYDSVAKTYLLGDTVGGYICPFTGVPAPADPDTLKAYREEAICYAAYRVLTWRYTNRYNSNCPNAPLNRPLNDTVTLPSFNALFLSLGYDSSYHGDNYANGNPADLGNYIGEQVIAYGRQDGANEDCGYSNRFYAPVNPPLVVKLPGNPNMVDPNRWQALSLDYSIDQSGQVLPAGVQNALSPEWGNVVPFDLPDSIRKVNNRGGHDYTIYEDPGPPPYLDSVNGGGLSDPFKWSHTLVSVWSSHLDATDSVMWDISPASIGNVQSYPTNIADYPNFYDILNGGDPGTGYTVNPKTGQPYTPQIVPRGDYVRILAEFWADGPDSETPPGHWFTILNYVNDHPLFVKRWAGKGPVLDDLEWDVKAYFTLGGAVHDAAITSWGLKGWYDWVRPISAIRYMAREGQSSDTSLSNYSPKGIPLIPGYIEVIQPGDPLDSNGLYTGEIKVKAWKGSRYIPNPDTDVAGVDWILAANWVPYQRPTFVTPPFPGYTSGHSTYSRTAAEVMTRITGDPYFPGGMGTFPAPKNQFLVFEDGPSMDVTLQWATYVDASDQCSLSRIWGGIHPPADDMPGRLAGMKLGPAAFNAAEYYFDSEKPTTVSVAAQDISDADVGTATFSVAVSFNENMDTSSAPVIAFPVEDPSRTITFNSGVWSDWKNYIAYYDVADSSETIPDVDVRITGTKDIVGNEQEQYDAQDVFSIDTRNPLALSVMVSQPLITDLDSNDFVITVTFDKDMSGIPLIEFPVEDPSSTLTFNSAASSWMNATTYQAMYSFTDANETIQNIDIRVSNGTDVVGNVLEPFVAVDKFSIDTKNPEVVSVTPSVYVITKTNVGIGNFDLTVLFDEAMDTSLKFGLIFPVEDPLAKTLAYNAAMSHWNDAVTYVAKYDVADSSQTLMDIDVEVATVCSDLAGNVQLPYDEADKFSIDMGNSGIADNNNSPRIKIYPNPASGGAKLNMEIQQLQSEAIIRIFDVYGKPVIDETIYPASRQNIQIPTDQLSSGLYLVRVEGRGVDKAFKIQMLGK